MESIMPTNSTGFSSGKNSIMKGDVINDVQAAVVVYSSFFLLILSLIPNITIIRGLVSYPDKNALVAVLGALSVSNLLITLVMMPLTLVTHTSWYIEPKQFGCKTLACINTLPRVINFLSIVLLGTERYLAVRFPSFYRESATTLKAIFIISVLWFFSFLICLVTSTNGIIPNFLLPARCSSVVKYTLTASYLLPCIKIFAQIFPIILIILTYRALNIITVRVHYSHQQRSNISAQPIDDSDRNSIPKSDIRASRNIQAVIILNSVISVCHGVLFLPIFGDSHFKVLFFEILVLFLLVVLQSWMTLLLSPRLRCYLCVWRVVVTFNINRFPQIMPVPPVQHPVQLKSIFPAQDIPVKHSKMTPRREIPDTATQIQFSVSSAPSQLTLAPFPQSDTVEKVRRFSNTSAISISVSSRRGSMSDDMEMSIIYPINISDGNLVGTVNSSKGSLSSTCSMNINDIVDETPRVKIKARAKLSVTSVKSVDEYGFLTPGPVYQNYHKYNSKQNKQTNASRQSPPCQTAQSNHGTQKLPMGQLMLTDELAEGEGDESLKQESEEDRKIAWAINAESSNQTAIQDTNTLSVGGHSSRKAISLPLMNVEQAKIEENMKPRAHSLLPAID